VLSVIAQIVRFKSRLTDEQVLERYEARSPQYRAMPGLWESEEALKAFSESELRRTIPDACKIQGTSDILAAEVVMVLRPERVPVGP